MKVIFELLHFPICTRQAGFCEHFYGNAEALISMHILLTSSCTRIPAGWFPPTLIQQRGIACTDCWIRAVHGNQQDKMAAMFVVFESSSNEIYKNVTKLVDMVAEM